MNEQVGDANSGNASDIENKKDDAASSVSVENKNIDLSPCWIEVLPSDIGVFLCAVLVNIMTEGLTSRQKNILGNFISSVGQLISYKSSRDELDEN